MWVAPRQLREGRQPNQRRNGADVLEAMRSWLPDDAQRIEHVALSSTSDAGSLRSLRLH